MKGFLGFCGFLLRLTILFLIVYTIFHFIMKYW